MSEPFNPLARVSLADSVSRALLGRPLSELPQSRGRKDKDRFLGAGVYAIYYLGGFPHYQGLTGADHPIYVGKAIPKGGRIGGMTSLAATSDSLYLRLKEHAKSIEDAINLELSEFRCRYLPVDDIFIPLGENQLIELFRPVWNSRLSGFGNHDPGGRRSTQQRSPWDTVHPGRRWATKLADYPQSAAEIWERFDSGGSTVREEDLDEGDDG